MTRVRCSITSRSVSDVVASRVHEQADLVEADMASLNGGWMQYYSAYPGGFIKKPGDDESGNSLHITSLSGASVSLQFHGGDIPLNVECRGSLRQSRHRRVPVWFGKLYLFR